MIVYNKVVIKNLGDDTQMYVESEDGQEETIWLGPNYPCHPSRDFDSNDDLNPDDLHGLSELLLSAYMRTVFAETRAVEGWAEKEEADGEVKIEDALERLDIVDDRVHTFRNTEALLLGADWDIDQLKELIEKHGVQEAGDLAKGLRHGLVVEDDVGPLFLATKEVK